MVNTTLQVSVGVVDSEIQREREREERERERERERKRKRTEEAYVFCFGSADGVGPHVHRRWTRERKKTEEKRQNNATAIYALRTYECLFKVPHLCVPI
jgi:hypothetical protein